jgi:hypothetical protein
VSYNQSSRTHTITKFSDIRDILSVACRGIHSLFLLFWAYQRTLYWYCNTRTESRLHCYLQWNSALRSPIFCVITQRVVVISYRRCGTTYQSHFQRSRSQNKACCPNTEFIQGRMFGIKSFRSVVSAAITGFLLDSWTLKMGPRGCPEMSVRNYHYALRNIPEEHSSHLLRGGSLKTREECAGFRVKYISDNAHCSNIENCPMLLKTHQFPL